MGMPIASQNWVTFHACHLIPPMQPALIGYEGGQLRTAFSFLTQPVDPKLFARARIIRSIMPASFHNFPAPYEFPMVFSLKCTENTDRARRNVCFVSVCVPTLRGALRRPCPHIRPLWCNCMHAITYPQCNELLFGLPKGGSRLLFLDSAKWHETFSARWHHP